MWSQPAQKWDEVAITVPLDGELKIRQCSDAISRKESLHKRLIPEALELLMMRQEELDQAGIFCLQGALILCIKVAGAPEFGCGAPLQIVGYLNMLPP